MYAVPEITVLHCLDPAIDTVGDPVALPLYSHPASSTKVRVLPATRPPLTIPEAEFVKVPLGPLQVVLFAYVPENVAESCAIDTVPESLQDSGRTELAIPETKVQSPAMSTGLPGPAPSPAQLRVKTTPRTADHVWRWATFSGVDRLASVDAVRPDRCLERGEPLDI